MVPVIPVLGAIAAVGALGAAFKYMRTQQGQNTLAQISAQCDGLRTQMESLAASGGDPHQIEQLRVQYADCRRRFAAAGGAVDEAADTLLTCNETMAYMRAVAADYARTDYVDTVARGNKRNAVLSQGAALVQCLQTAVDQSTTPAQLDAVIADIQQAIADSVTRASNYVSRVPGWDRMNEIEARSDQKAAEELQTIAIPLGAPWAAGWVGPDWQSSVWHAQNTVDELAQRLGDTTVPTDMVAMDGSRRLAVDSLYKRPDGSTMTWPVPGKSYGLLARALAKRNPPIDYTRALANARNLRLNIPFRITPGTGV